MIGIKHVSSYLPAEVLGNEEVQRRFGFKADFLERRIGVFKRRIAAPGESTSDLSVKAAERLLRETGLDPKDVDLVVLCTQNPDYKLPHTSAIVQDRLGIPSSAAAFDINLGCSGFVYGLTVVHGWMQVHDSRNALLITCDPYTKVMDPTDRTTVPIFSDAAAATWISRDADNTIGKSVFGTDGAHHRALIVKNSGTRLDAESKGPGCLFMDGRLILEVMIKTIPGVVRQCSEKNGLSLGQIDLFILHQASAHILNSLRERIGIPQEKMFVNLGEIGNTVSSTIPLALEEVLGKGDLMGKNVLLCGFGVGLSWGATVLRFGGNHDQPDGR